MFGRATIRLGMGPHSTLWSPYVIGQTINIFMLFMVALCNRAYHYIFILFLLLLSYFFFFLFFLA